MKMSGELPHICNRAVLMSGYSFTYRSVGEERLRICLHTFNEDDDIQKLCSLLLESNGVRIK